MKVTIQSFFACSEWVDRFVLRPLSHIRPNWELTWDARSHQYCPEEDSFADLLNALIQELGNTNPPSQYHNNEDTLAAYVQRDLNWGIQKRGNKWVNADGRPLGPDDYLVLLEQGGFGDINQSELISAAAGRIYVAIAKGQSHFDDMEESHQYILAGVLAAVLYHRADE